MYVIIWKFAAKPGLEKKFEEAYGAHGVWAEFFRRGQGYLETELLRDMEAPGHYMTIDRWDSKAAYEAFRSRFAAEYSAIDRRCEALTQSETEIGAYETLTAGESESREEHHEEI